MLYVILPQIPSKNTTQIIFTKNNKDIYAVCTPLYVQLTQEFVHICTTSCK